MQNFFPLFEQIIPSSESKRGYLCVLFFIGTQRHSY